MIEVRNLVKVYGEHLAVDHISFTLEPGLIYGFLGPNGAGKSTTMNMMTGYLGATSGQVFINGHSILEEPEDAGVAEGVEPGARPGEGEEGVVDFLECRPGGDSCPSACGGDADFLVVAGEGVELFVCHIAWLNDCHSSRSASYPGALSIAGAVLR